jgi:hypothetical protein
MECRSLEVVEWRGTKGSLWSLEVEDLEKGIRYEGKHTFAFLETGILALDLYYDECSVVFGGGAE